jgi:hypothetical protein
LHGGDAGDGGELLAHGVGCAFQPGEDVGETVFAVVGVAGRFEREDERPGGDHHGETARHDEGDGERLRLQRDEIAEQFSVEETHGRKSFFVLLIVLVLP